MNANVYLSAFLAPLSPWLSRPEVTDLLVNAPGEVWVETASEGMRREPAPGLDETTLQRLVRQIAAISSQGVSREHPLLSATLPDGARVQVAAPPATRGGTVLAVRKHLISDFSLEDLAGGGLFDGATPRDPATDADSPHQAPSGRRGQAGRPARGRAPSQDDRDLGRHRQR